MKRSIASNKWLLLIVVIFVFNTKTTAQYSAGDINRYANWGDPGFNRNKRLWHQYQVCATQDPRDTEGMNAAHSQIDEDWWDLGLSTIWVPNEEAKDQLLEAIIQEYKKLKEVQVTKTKAYVELPESKKCNYCKRTLAYWNEYIKMGRLNRLHAHIRIGKDRNSPPPKQDNNQDEKEFLAEISKINYDISVINNLANNRELEKSLLAAQILCDKIRLLQGQQYFSSTLKKIRKKNPSFSFSITPLAEQVTREYWIKMRNRANLSYRNAMEAYTGCVYNEGIQQAGYVEIPMGFAKATYDLVTNWKDMIGGSLFGTFTSLKKNSIKGDYAIRSVNIVGEDIMKAGGDAYDWKSYTGLVGGLISAYDGYVKTYNMAVENYAQGDLLVLNRQSAQQLIVSNKLLLQEFDRYRAFIESQSSSIDCLNDRLMRLNMDNSSIKGDKITIWGTGNFDWDGEEFIAMIKEGGEDLKSEYIYCEDFVKTLQIAVNLATTDYYTIEEKVKNSGADQSQITAQLSYNEENGAWFEQESLRLSEYYAQFCDNNTYPDDVVVVSTQVVPGAEEQDGDPDAPPVWEYEADNLEPYSEPVYHEPVNHDPDYNPHQSRGATTGIITTGNGWSEQKTTTNQSDLQNDITSAVESGNTPAGIYVGDDGEVVVYYIDDNPLGMTAWNLEWYNGVESLQNGINSNLEEGYFPMGISFTDHGQLYVLYIMSQLQATAWQLVESELDLGYVTNDVQPYVNEKYIPVGITVFDGMYYTLLAQVPDSENVNWTIEGYENNNYTIQQGINNAVNSGFVPFGYLREQGIVNLLYIGF